MGQHGVSGRPVEPVQARRKGFGPVGRRVKVRQIGEQGWAAGFGFVQQIMDPGPRFPVVAWRHVLDALETFQPGQVGLPALLEVVGQAADVFCVDPATPFGDFEILRQPLVEPERQVAHGRVKQGVGGLVAEVFLKAVVVEGVHHPLRPLGEEEGAAGGEFRVVKREEMAERVAVAEDVDVDRRLVGRRPQAEVSRHVVFERPQRAADGRVDRDGSLRVNGEGPDPRLQPRGHQRLPGVAADRGAADGREGQQERGETKPRRGGRGSASLIPRGVRHGGMDLVAESRLASGEPTASPLISLDFLAGPRGHVAPETLPVVVRREPPGEVRLQEMQRVPK